MFDLIFNLKKMFNSWIEKADTDLRITNFNFFNIKNFFS